MEYRLSVEGVYPDPNEVRPLSFSVPYGKVSLLQLPPEGGKTSILDHLIYREFIGALDQSYPEIANALCFRDVRCERIRGLLPVVHLSAVSEKIPRKQTVGEFLGIAHSLWTALVPEAKPSCRLPAEVSGACELRMAGTAAVISDILQWSTALEGTPFDLVFAAEIGNLGGNDTTPNPTLTAEPPINASTGTEAGGEKATSRRRKRPTEGGDLAQLREAVLDKIKTYRSLGFQRFIAWDTLYRYSPDGAEHPLVVPRDAAAVTPFGVVVRVLSSGKLTTTTLTEAIAETFTLRSGLVRIVALPRAARGDVVSLDATCPRWTVIDGAYCTRCGFQLPSFELRRLAEYRGSATVPGRFVPRSESPKKPKKPAKTAAIAANRELMLVRDEEPLGSIIELPVAELLSRAAAPNRDAESTLPPTVLELLNFLSRDAGLGSLRLGADLSTLSAGERLLLTISVFPPESTAETLFVCDEPSRYLTHPQLELFLDWCDAIAAAGNTVLLAESLSSYATARAYELAAFLPDTSKIRSRDRELGDTELEINASPSAALGAETTHAVAARISAPGGSELSSPPLPSVDRGGAVAGGTAGTFEEQITAFLSLCSRRGSCLSLSQLGSSRSADLIRSVSSVPQLSPRGRRTKGNAPRTALLLGPQPRTERPRRGDRRTVASLLGLAPLIARRYAAERLARRQQLSEASFTVGLRGDGVRGCCDECAGLGQLPTWSERHVFDWTECTKCSGAGFLRDVLEVAVDGLSIVELLALPAHRVARMFPNDRAVQETMVLAHQLQLAALPLRAPAATFGQSTREQLALATALSRTNPERTTLLLDQAFTGTEESAVLGAAAAASAFLHAGGSVVLSGCPRLEAALNAKPLPEAP